FLTARSAPALSPLSLHDALPICRHPALGEQQRVHVVEEGEHRRTDLLAAGEVGRVGDLLADGPAYPRLGGDGAAGAAAREPAQTDRKSTRLNSSHVKISYAVFCL